MKSVIRSKVTVKMHTLKKKTQINNLMMHLSILERQEHFKSEANRKKEIRNTKRKLMK